MTPSSSGSEDANLAVIRWGSPLFEDNLLLRVFLQIAASAPSYRH